MSELRTTEKVPRRISDPDMISALRNFLERDEK
jgi:hypothetical protein